MRLTRCLSLFGLILAFGLNACAADLTAPPAAAEAMMAGSSANATVVTNDSHWETWPIGTFFLCTGTIASGGEYKVHLQSRYLSRADGSTLIRYHVNSAAAYVMDNAGNEFVLQQVGNGMQTSLPTGAYVAVETQNFRLISPGQYVNQFLTYTVTITGDGVNPTPVVTFELVKNSCTG